MKWNNDTACCLNPFNKTFNDHDISEATARQINEFLITEAGVYLTYSMRQKV